MHVRENEPLMPPPAAAPEPSAPRPLPSPLGIWEGGWTDGRRHLPTSRPWFYPVVEQHDVTYHRVKPLTWHRRQRHNAKRNKKMKYHQQKNNIYREVDPQHSRRKGERMETCEGWRDGWVKEGREVAKRVGEPWRQLQETSSGAAGFLASTGNHWGFYLFIRVPACLSCKCHFIIRFIIKIKNKNWQ